jgi:hypothetical protein
MLNQYNKVLEINISKHEKKSAHGKDNGYCRFCMRIFPEVTFKNEAHIIPKSLGNKYLLSKHECDECNALFAKYDDNLAKHLAMYRAFLGIILLLITE